MKQFKMRFPLPGRAVALFAAAAGLSAGLWTGPVMAQGITRSTGLGLRGSFWRTNSRSTGLRLSTQGSATDIEIEGFGGSLTFFSRLYHNWFMETSLGSMSRIHILGSGSSKSSVDISAVIPITLGARYDFLTGRTRNAIQPYLCAGGGTYWLVRTQVADGTDADDVDDEETWISADSDCLFGAYTGFGAHFTLASWFALNFDTRYHFVDFSTTDPNGGFEVGLGFCFMWGQKREIFKVTGVKVIVEDIYPAYYRFYNTYPLAMATIENTAEFPIEVNLRSKIDRITDGVRQSGFITIPRGETRDLPVFLLFGPELLRAETREPAVIDLEIEARAGVSLRKTFSAQVTVHSRNAWNGEIDKLPVFVTPEDSAVLAFGRRILKGDTSSPVIELGKFRQAGRLFRALGEGGLRYRSDPNIPFDRDDRVQFAAATLALGTGDCDDLAVLAGSLFESIGISTAFVDVRDPEAAQGHVYLLFNTGLAPDRAGLISSNPRRTVVRPDASGSPTLWIPLETTLVQEGFETAWTAGATQYEEQGSLRQGLAEGWMKIIDVR
jgi:outer membrane protein W